MDTGASIDCGAQQLVQFAHQGTDLMRKLYKLESPRVGLLSNGAEPTKGNKLVKKTDYTLKYASGRKAVGTYTVTVTFKGEYSGKKTLKFKIVPPAVKNLKAKAGYKSAALTWDRNKFADTYVVYCATAKDGKYKKLGSTAKLGYTVTGLKTGTYYFKVVAVRKLDTGNFKSAASAIRKATVK